MKICMENLRDYPQFINTVVEWIYSEWGNNNRRYWDSWVKSSLAENEIPQTYIAFVDERIAGTYSLWRCDLQSRQDLCPWFGGLYVSPEFRGKEIEGMKLGVRMQFHALQQVKKLGYNKVYLFTEKNPRYYVANGWKVLSLIPDENDEDVTLCEYCFD